MINSENTLKIHTGYNLFHEHCYIHLFRPNIFKKWNHFIQTDIPGEKGERKKRKTERERKEKKEK